MDEANKEAILSAVKAALLVIGSSVTTLFGLAEAKVAAATSLVLTLVTLGWTIYDRLQKSKSQQADLATAVNAGVALPADTPPVTPAEAKAIVAEAKS